MLTRKSKYGLKALLLLAEEAGKGPVLVSELAERQRIPKKFLEAILLDLKRHGFLVSKKGKGGGYLLSRPKTHQRATHQKVTWLWHSQQRSRPPGRLTK